MHTEWRCDSDGAVLPLHVPRHINAPIVEAARARVVAGAAEPLPMWSPWPMLPGWTITGVGWVGDDRSGVRATVVACSGPCPVEHGPADILIIAEEPGVGLGPRFAGIPGPDPGPFLERVPAVTEHGWLGGTDGRRRPGATAGDADMAGQAKVRADGWPTPLWLVKSPEDRCAYAGEARGLWLYLISWPAVAGYVLAEDLLLHDLVESLPSQLLYGAPAPNLHSPV